MTLLEAITRWLRNRQAAITPTTSGTRVELAPGDSLETVLGNTFVLANSAPESAPLPGVEPVYSGSRIVDLFTEDVEGVRGIAAVAAEPGSNLGAPLFIISFRAVYQANKRAERLIQVTLTENGEETDAPPEPAVPLLPAGEGLPWLESLKKLLPRSVELARAQVIKQCAEVEKNAQSDLYLVARRLANYYGKYRQRATSTEEIDAEYRNRLSDEVDRHRLQVTVDLIGARVVIPHG